MKNERKWLPTLAELIDRLSIHQLKEVFISEYKDKYRLEMTEIIHDINIILKEGDIQITGEIIRAIIVLSQINTHIWYNESNVRKGKDQDLSLLKLTHSLNGIRNNASNYILSLIGDGGHKNYKIDCLAAEYKSWDIKMDLNS